MLYILMLILHFNNPPINGNLVASQNQVNSDIVVHIDKIKNLEGEILVGVYNSKKSFRKIKKVYKYVIKSVENGKEVIIIKDVPPGNYAIAVFQDMNGNRKFDTNFMGIPKEPFGFSSNYIVKRRAPKFKEVVFNHSDNSNTELEINMQKW